MNNSGNSSSSSGLTNSGNANQSNSGNSTNDLSSQSSAGIGSSGNSHSANRNDSSAANNGSNVTIGGNTSNYEAAKIPVATAIAPVVVTGTDQCLVPISVGIQALTVGVSGGNAIRDENCEVIKLARLLEGMGEHAIALEVLRGSDPRVAKAMESVAASKAPTKAASAPNTSQVALRESQRDRVALPGKDVTDMRTASLNTRTIEPSVNVTVIPSLSLVP
jgi:hypothetical protein